MHCCSRVRYIRTCRVTLRCTNKLTLALLGCLCSYASLFADGVHSTPVTAIGFTTGFEQGSVGNFTPALALTQGSTGLISYFGTAEGGYRMHDAKFMARVTVEGYFLFFGAYGGFQSNSGGNDPADYGFPMGLAFLLPPRRHWLLKLHVGAAIYTKNQANEFQLALSAFYRL